MTDRLRALLFDATSPGAAQGASWGWIGLVASSRGLRLLTLPVPSHDEALAEVRKHYPEVPLTPADPFLSDVAGQVREYLAGERRIFAVELDLRGHNPFALAVWAVASRIPYGQTRTYSWIAEQIGGVGAAQAVGVALSINPIPLIIPCHRVIGADGGLHGYAGGLLLKARLLALESGQAQLPLG